MRKFGGFILFTFTIVPFLPMDGSGILAGICRYPLHRFYLYIGSASAIKMIGLFYGFIMFQDKLLEWISRTSDDWPWIFGTLKQFFSL